MKLPKLMRPLLPPDAAFEHQGSAAEWERALGPLPIADITAVNCYLSDTHQLAYGGLFKRVLPSGVQTSCGRAFVLVVDDPEAPSPLPEKERIAGYARIECFLDKWTLRFRDDVPAIGDETLPNLTVPLPNLEDDPKAFAFALTRYLGVWRVAYEAGQRRRLAPTRP